jgi:quercetin dioxygenase-like cupin family protein
MKTLTLSVVLILVVVVGSSTIAQQTPNRPGGVVILKSAEVQWTDYAGRPGVKLAVIEGDMTKAGPFMIRVKFPANYALGPHTHPGVEHTTVLSGTLQIGYGTKEDGPAEKLPAGTVIVTPPNTPHFLRTIEETVVQTHGIGPWGSTPVK